MKPIDKKSCAVCAWREDCKKRYSRGDDYALRCPDFTFDVRLKSKEDEGATNHQEENQKPGS